MKKGDIIKFGNYPQDSYGRKSPIEWIVLDVNENEALLISRHGLDCKQYHHERTKITWEYCDLRKWLNNDFIRSAFSMAETKRIIVSELKNDENREDGINGGNDTMDRVFCLSIDEAVQYFRRNSDRQCKKTKYAQTQSSDLSFSYNDFCGWWLRSPGGNQSFAARVIGYGSVEHLIGYLVNDDTVAVRPALRINL